MSLRTATYQPAGLESDIYETWLASDCFRATPDQRPAYSIVIPPPNVTGVLHMGHMLNNTLQDILVRRARMLGKNAVWVPGTDHASIATEAKVVALLKEQGIDKSSLTREAFLTHAWAWKEKYGGIILQQLQKLGASCDWQRTRFTMEPDLTEAVLDVFIRLHQDGFIYRGKRMVNWDPAGLTALSDEEVIYQEAQGHLYYVSYALTDGSGHLTIATTRPETILADTALCVHPDDPRFTHVIGKTVKVPLTSREIPVIADPYVDPEFGTGCLKVTPAHDPNDYMLGEKHQLAFIDMFEANGTVAPTVDRYVGMDRFAVRTQIAIDLEKEGVLVKKEPIVHQVGFSERTRVPIEPRVSLQWFVNMKAFMEKHPEVLTSVMDGTIAFHPPKFKNTYRHWMENIKDWCISRQLWWGQRIPAWYGPDGKVFVAKTREEAWSQAANHYPGKDAQSLHQDEDVLDTWFSSWLWPISVFDGFKNPNNPDIQYYYPTADLVTGPDILFFWVARMIMAGYAFTGKAPFKNVYFTGIVRDKQGRKMSKQLGNSPDALALIDQYGADGVRVGLLMSAAAGNDLLFDESLCGQGRNFANKIFNAAKLISGWEPADIPADEASKMALQWYAEQSNQALLDIEEHFEKFRISDALTTTYKWAWDDFCAWYLEWVKPAHGAPMSREIWEATRQHFSRLLRALHPFMPFITEMLWEDLQLSEAGGPLVHASWPETQPRTHTFTEPFEWMKEAIAGVRQFRQKQGISPKEKLTLYIQTEQQPWPKAWNPVLEKLAGIETPVETTQMEAQWSTFLVKQWQMGLPSTAFNPEEEKIKIQEELTYLEGFLKSVQQKLSNTRFVEGAPEQVVANERKKEADALAKIQNLKAALEGLSA